MAKQEIKQFASGPILIFQKDASFNGTSFVIGFRSGAQLDGEYEGIMHLLEHLLFRGADCDKTMSILNNMLKVSVEQNAYTTENFMGVNFTAVEKNVEIAVKHFMKMLTNKNFTQEQIDREIPIVLHERDLSKAIVSAYETFFNEILKDKPMNGERILGSKATLKKITPELLTKIVERYFNLNNLVISVTSNKSMSEIEELCEKLIFPKLKPAEKNEYVVDFSEVPTLEKKNLLIAIPNQYASNVKVNLILRNNTNIQEDVNKAYAYNIVEEYVMNNLGGTLWERLRVKNSLVYCSSMGNFSVGNENFKGFNAITNASKMRVVIKELSELVKNLSRDGISEKDFNIVKNALVDNENATIQKFNVCTAMGNLQDVLSGSSFIDYKKVMNYIKDMNYEEFNENIKSDYACSNVSATIDGNFDSRDVPHLIEIEEWTGDHSNSDSKQIFNKPIYEATIIPDQTINVDDLIPKQKSSIPTTNLSDVCINKNVEVKAVDSAKKEDKKQKKKKVEETDKKKISENKNKVEEEKCQK